MGPATEGIRVVSCQGVKGPRVYRRDKVGKFHKCADILVSIVGTRFRTSHHLYRCRDVQKFSEGIPELRGKRHLKYYKIGFRITLDDPTRGGIAEN